MSQGFKKINPGVFVKTLRGLFVLAFISLFFLFSFSTKTYAKSTLHTAKYFIFTNVHGYYGANDYGQLTLSQGDIDTLTNDFNTMVSTANTNLGGKLTITPVVTVISTSVVMHFDANAMLPASELNTVLKSLGVWNQIDDNVDFVFSTAHNPFSGGRCGETGNRTMWYGQPIGWQVHGVVYSNIVSPGASNCNMSNPNYFIFEFQHQLDTGLDVIMNRPDMYDVYGRQGSSYNGGTYPQSLCGNTSPSNNYNWFPDVEQREKVPDFVACQNYYNLGFTSWKNSVLPADGDLTYFQYLLSTHFPDQANISSVSNSLLSSYTGNYCRNGVKDVDETSVDNGPSCDNNNVTPTSAPTSLTQYKSDGTTVISLGGNTSETSVVLKFSMTSPNASDTLTPQVEIKPVGTSFTGTVTNSGSAVAYSGSPVTGVVTVTGLTPGVAYHWQANMYNAEGTSPYSSANIYFIVGSLWGTSTAGTPNPTIHFPNPHETSFVTIGASSATLEADKVAVDSSNNYFYAGVTSANAVNFNPTGGTDNQTPTGTAAYLTKINANGTYGFTYLANGATTMSVKGLKTDSSGNAYLLGQFSGTATFSPGTINSYASTGPNPYSVAKGDFNNDGKMDIAVANYNSNNVAILLGNADGTFTYWGSLATGNNTNPKAIAVGNFNGKASIVVADYTSGKIGVFLNTTSGSTLSFNTVVNYTAGTNPTAIAVGDLNNDGNPDIITANNGSNNISVFLNLGTGTFPGAGTTYSSGSLPTAVAIGNLNGDSYSDIAVANSGDTDFVTFNNIGSGNPGIFPSSPSQTYNLISSPNAIAIGNLGGPNSGSNNLDVVAGLAGGYADVFLNQGSGTFPAGGVTYTVGSALRSVAIGDLNGDGKQDIVTTSSSQNKISVLLNQGSGTFPATATYYSAGTGTPYGAVLADLRNLGTNKADVIVADYSFGRILTFLNNGDGTYPANGVAYYAPGPNPYAVAKGDFNGDGKMDIAVANYNSNNVAILLGNGDGTFTYAASLTTGTNPRSIAVGDFNNDGKPDIAVANYGSNNISVFLNTSSGGTTSFAAASTYTAGTHPYSITVGDLKNTNNGQSDIAVANYGSSNISIFLNKRDSTGTFNATANQTIQSDSFGGGVPEGIAIGNLNGDSYPDIAVVNNANQDLDVFLNNYNSIPGNFNTSPSSEITLSYAPVSIAIGDLDGTNNADIAVGESIGIASADVRVFLNLGSGTFGTGTGYTIGANPVGVTIGDLNGDGKQDIVTTSSSQNKISVLLNQGSGTFPATATYYSTGFGSSPNGVVLADSRNLGTNQADVITANYSGGQISAFLNQNNGAGTFSDIKIAVSGGKAF